MFEDRNVCLARLVQLIALHLKCTNKYRVNAFLLFCLLTLCLLGSFACFFVFSVFVFFQNPPFRNTIRVSNSLDLDQAGHFVGPDLGPNCLQN